MKKYWVVSCVVVATPVIVILIVLFRWTVGVQNLIGLRKEVLLNTLAMQEANLNPEDSLMGPGLISAFYAHKKGNSDAIPWADVYICVSRPDSITTDTTLILSTKLSQTDEPSKPYIYWTGLKVSRRFNACKIFVPAGQTEAIKHYKYLYADVILVTDD